jgi:hypothetical protein
MNWALMARIPAAEAPVAALLFGFRPPSALSLPADADLSSVDMTEWRGMPFGYWLDSIRVLTASRAEIDELLVVEVGIWCFSA